MTLHPIAIHAARAGRCYRQWGRYATLRFCERHGVPLSLLTLARILAESDRASSEKDISKVQKIMAKVTKS